MKKIVSLLVLFVLALSLAACGGNTAAQAQVTWKISVEGISDGAVEFTNVDYDKLNTVDVDATKKKKDGTEVTQKFTGVPFSKVVEYLGVKDYSQIVVEAKDGYSKEYASDIVNSPGAVFAIKADGKELGEGDGPVELVIEGQSGNMWIKNVAKIKVVK